MSLETRPPRQIEPVTHIRWNELLHAIEFTRRDAPLQDVPDKEWETVVTYETPEAPVPGSAS